MAESAWLGTLHSVAAGHAPSITAYYEGGSAVMDLDRELNHKGEGGENKAPGEAELLECPERHNLGRIAKLTVDEIRRRHHPRRHEIC